MSDLSRIAAASLLVATVALPVMAAGDEAQRFIPDIIISSTIPANGDLNPYGVAIVPPGFPSDGTIAPGDILVSNFNNNTITTQNPGGIQGTGTTIIRLPRNGPIAPAVPAGQPGNATTFFQGSGLGLTTALGVLQRGFVLVGNVPTSGGVIQPGSLLLLDKNGNQLTLSNSSSINALLSDPWDLTIDDRFDHALVFVSNVNNPVTNSGQMQNNNGFVTRLELTISTNDVSVKSATMIANGYTVAANSAALVLGPTGLAYDPTTDTLYVASTNDNSIFAVPHAGSRTGSSGTGAPIFRDEHLRGPLALVLAPNGDLLTSNGDAVNGDPTQPSEILEFTKTGKFVGQFNVDAGQGGAFGLATTLVGLDTARLAFVDDNANNITVIDQNLSSGD